VCSTSNAETAESDGLEVSEKAPEISACEATTVASVAVSRAGEQAARASCKQLAGRDRRAARRCASVEIVEQRGNSTANQPMRIGRAEMPRVREHGLAAVTTRSAPEDQQLRGQSRRKATHAPD